MQKADVRLDQDWLTPLCNLDWGCQVKSGHKQAKAIIDIFSTDLKEGTALKGFADIIKVRLANVPAYVCDWNRGKY